MVDAPFILLASRSPRRAALLREAGYAFEQVSPGFDDPAQPGVGDAQRPPGELAVHLAQRKARSVTQAQGLKQEAVLLAADTVMVGPDGELMGQPATVGEARGMLEALVGRSHTVHTGVCLLGMAGAESRCFEDVAQVHLGHVARGRLDAYIVSDQWRGKAGGYNLFELQGQWPFRVTGDPTTVVGLPMQKLAACLEAYWAKRRRSIAP